MDDLVQVTQLSSRLLSESRGMFTNCNRSL